MELDISKRRKLFASNLRYYMNARAFTQAKMAEISGVALPSIGSYVEARALPQAGKLHKIAEALGVTVDNLFAEERNGEEKKTTPKETIYKKYLTLRGDQKKIVDFILNNQTT